MKKSEIKNIYGAMLFESDAFSLKELTIENKENLKRADLCCADLEGVDLQYADLRGANLEDANLEKATNLPK